MHPVLSPLKQTSHPAVQGAQAPTLLTYFPLSHAKIFFLLLTKSQRKTPAPQSVHALLAALYYLAVHMAFSATFVPPFLLAAMTICIM
jgi:hypothetical protein